MFSGAYEGVLAPPSFLESPMASPADVEQVQRLIARNQHVTDLTVEGVDPNPCDVCRFVLKMPAPRHAVVNGKTMHDVWAEMCEGCFREVGVGLGLGRGQVILYHVSAS